MKNLNKWGTKRHTDLEECDYVTDSGMRWGNINTVIVGDNKSSIFVIESSV